MNRIPELAVEIDRTVLAVGTRAGTRDRDRFLDATAGIPDAARKLLPRLAFFLLAGPIPRSFASERVTYTDVAVVDEAVADLVASGHLVDMGGGEVAPGPTLIPALRTVVDGRAAMAAELWGAVPGAVERCAEHAGRVRAAVPREASIAWRHVAISESDDPILRCYERLTTVRYVRADAHRLAWRGFDCTGPLMVQLTAAWHDERPADTAVLEERGWWDGDGITLEGRRVRDEIEVRTNELNAEFLAGAGDDVADRLTTALGELPGTPVPRPL